MIDLLKTLKYDEMVYAWNGESKVLVDAKYKGYRFLVLSISGHHPCAYVKIPKNHPVVQI